MPTLTVPYESFEKPGLVINYKLTNAKVFKGGLIALLTTGYATAISPATASLKFIGVANETIDNSAGSAGDRAVNVTKCGSFVFKAASGYTPTVADIGKEVYAASDWEVQVSSSGLTNAYKVGTIVGIEYTSTGATGVRVRIDNYVA